MCKSLETSVDMVALAKVKVTSTQQQVECKRLLLHMAAIHALLRESWEEEGSTDAFFLLQMSTLHEFAPVHKCSGVYSARLVALLCCVRCVLCSEYLSIVGGALS